MCITAASQELTAIHIDHKGIASALVSQALPRESPIQGHTSGDESSGKLYEASGAWRNTAQGLGKYGRGMESVRQSREAGAHRERSPNSEPCEIS